MKYILKPQKKKTKQDIQHNPDYNPHFNIKFCGGFSLYVQTVLVSTEAQTNQRSFMPKLMFLDVNVIRGGGGNIAIFFWPGPNRLPSSSRYSFTGPCGLLYLWDIVKVYSMQQILLQAFYMETMSHRSGLLQRNVFEEVEFKFNMH